VRNDLLGHIIVELKGQLDSYAAGNYTKAASQYYAAYNHMFMTCDLAVGAIAKQKGAQVTSSVDPHGATGSAVPRVCVTDATDRIDGAFVTLITLSSAIPFLLMGRG
jgi:hypothetical protein